MSSSPRKRSPHVALRLWRTQHGASKAAFAKALGVAPSTLLRWERGSVPSVEHAVAIESATLGALPASVWPRGWEPLRLEVEDSAGAPSQ